jgi:hypothetical protein
MFYLLMLLIGIGLSVVLVAKIKQLPPTQKKWLLIQMAGGVVGISILLILLTGRAHWLGILIGIMIPLAKMYLTNKSSSADNKPNVENLSTSVEEIDIQEAMNILGLEGEISKGDITEDIVIDAHRKLIQKFHPDRGGNEYLAVKINHAKEVLLKTLQKKSE